jgi:CHAD domain-containing protein
VSNSGGYRLMREESAADGVRRIAAARAAKASERLRDASGEDTARAIHGARKDLKKIRAALRLVREDVGEKAYRRENGAYRDAGALLSESRDASVKLETLADLQERFDDAFPAGLARAWAAALEADRDRVAGASPTAESRIEEASAAIAAAAARIPDWRLGSGSWRLLEPGLTRGYRDGRRMLKRTRSEGSAENVHELRKRVKDLWYQLRLIGDAWPASLEASAREAHRLADLLGDHHDLSVLAEDLRGREDLGGREGPEADRGRAEQLIAERQAELLASALDLGARLYAEQPKCYRRRLRAYWRSWRRD